MFCPYCASKLTETSTRCAQCGFDLRAADRLFGEPPRLSLGINDYGKVLESHDNGAIMRRLRQLANNYPQVRFAIVTTELDAETSLPTLATWLLNRAGIFRTSERGGLNHGVLIAVSTDECERRASIQVGYGLEPFIGYRHLQGALEAAEPAFANDQFGEGILSIIDGVVHALEKVHDKIGATYGIDLGEIRSEESRRIGHDRAARKQAFSPAPERQIDEY